jgi:hypothetical protein
MRPLYSKPAGSVLNKSHSPVNDAPAGLKVPSGGAEEVEGSQNFDPKKKFIWDQTLMEGGNKNVEPNCKTQ